MIGIIDYGAGNIYSLQCALDRVGAAYKLVKSADDFDAYDRYIIPGVGHAKPAMEMLLNTGMVPLIKATKKPLLGVCLGMQLITSISEEGNTELLNLVPLHTKRFVSDDLKIPEMGWNTVDIDLQSVNPNPLFKGIPNGSYFYFVHSYFVEFSTAFTIAASEYGQKFSAGIQKDNFFGVQFHPEKSGISGELLLRNFVGF